MEPQYRAWDGAEVETFRVQMNEAMADLFEQVDIVLCATSPMEPFKAEGPMPYNVGEVAVSPYNAGALTIPANLSGYPAISIPAGLSSSGLPIGLQAYARRHEDPLSGDAIGQVARSVYHEAPSHRLPRSRVPGASGVSGRGS